MKQRSSHLSAILLALFPGIFLNHATAATVNVDIQVATGGAQTYSSTAAAPSTGTTWNGFAYGNNTLAHGLLDDQGGATDVSIWLQANPSEWSYTNDNALMKDYAYTNTNWANNTGQRFTIFSNVANGGTGMQLDGSKTYDIYVYTVGDSNGQFGTFQLNHGGGTVNLTSTGNGPFDGTFTEGADYLKFSGVSPKAYNISAGDNGYEFEFFWGRAAGNTTAAAFNGFQIVEVPEPSSSLAALLGGVGLLGLVRRRR